MLTREQRPESRINPYFVLGLKKINISYSRYISLSHVDLLHNNPPVGIFTTPLVEEVFFATSLFSSMKYILTLTYAIASSDEVNLTIKKVKKYIFYTEVLLYICLYINSGYIKCRGRFGSREGVIFILYKISFKYDVRILEIYFT